MLSLLSLNLHYEALNAKEATMWFGSMLELIYYSPWFLIWKSEK
jgi:hypothetical protein